MEEEKKDVICPKLIQYKAPIITHPKNTDFRVKAQVQYKFFFEEIPDGVKV